VITEERDAHGVPNGLISPVKVSSPVFLSTRNKVI